MKIYYFTNSYPYGQPDHWKTVELEEMISRGHEVTVVPFSDGSNPEILVELLDKVKYCTPLVRKGSLVTILSVFFKTLFSTLPVYFTREFFGKKVYRNREWMKDWLRDSYYTAALYFHPVIKQLGAQSDENTAWYFFWGRHSALLIPLIRRKNFKIACRFHGYDLYLDQNHGYIPYHENIIHGAGLLLPCSDVGARDLERKTGSTVPTQVARLGVEIPDEKGPGTGDRVPDRPCQGPKVRGKAKDNPEPDRPCQGPKVRGKAKDNLVPDRPCQGPKVRGKAKDNLEPDRQTIKKIVSCSSVVAVKRLMLLAQGLEYLDFAISWTHIGDGAQLEELKNYCRRFENTKIQIDLKGYIFHKQIPLIYEKENFDLFINVSSSEGIPVSIMEAFAAGIPVMATNVGGTNELVNSRNGILLNPSTTPVELANEIRSFFSLPPAVIQQMKLEAFETCMERYDARKNAYLLVSKLESL